ncbi:MAG: hypothetical protein WBE72_22505 [Terracidiphilus sp.]
MNASFLYLCGSLAFALPFLAIAVLLAHYCLRRAAWKRRSRKGRKSLGFCPSSVALGIAFLCMPVFYRPSIAFIVEARLQEAVEADDQGDPETPEKHLRRQFRRIRRGERVETLVLRL